VETSGRPLELRGAQRRRTERTEGFTLVELMGVVALVRVLTSVALSRFKTQPSQGRGDRVTNLLSDSRQRAMVGGPFVRTSSPPPG
jgi:Tfp pilus assembly protein FimT